jgi:hypothetical protein
MSKFNHSHFPYFAFYGLLNYFDQNFADLKGFNTYHNDIATLKNKKDDEVE